jgi:hypothetical protein
MAKQKTGRKGIKEDGEEERKHGKRTNKNMRRRKQER